MCGRSGEGCATQGQDESKESSENPISGYAPLLRGIETALFMIFTITFLVRFDGSEIDVDSFWHRAPARCLPPP